MNMIVSTAIAGTAVPAVAAEINDPIFAAIETHKVAAAETNAAQRRMSVFEDELQAKGRLRTADRLADERRKGEEIEAAIEEAHHSEQVTAYAVLDVNPTTTAGLIALLTYACEYDDVFRRRPAGARWRAYKKAPDDTGALCC
jgi:hypothetical protein